MDSVLFIHNIKLYQFSSFAFSIQSEYYSGCKRDQRNIDHRARRPAEAAGYLAENDDGRGEGAYEEHICHLADGYADQRIDDKGDEAERGEKLDRIDKVLFRASRAVREDYVKAEKNE